MTGHDFFAISYSMPALVGSLVITVWQMRLTQARTMLNKLAFAYSQVPIKRAGLNKRVGWLF